MTTPTPTITASSRESSVPWNKVEEYIVTYPANRRTPRINLVAGSGTFVGELVFMPNGATLPPDTRNQAHYHLDDFANVLDMLRNESPIYYIHNGPGDDDANGLQTGGTVGTRANPREDGHPNGDGTASTNHMARASGPISECTG